MLVTRSELRDALGTAGASLGTWHRPSTGEVLAAVALAATESYGAANNDLDGCRVTCFQIKWRPDAPAHTPRNRDWITSSLSNACLAAIALTHMHGLRLWPQYRSGEYRLFLPEAFRPALQQPLGEIPYQHVPVLAGVSLRELLRACGWIAPSQADADKIAQENGFATAQDIPAGFIARVNVQRGW